MRLGGWGGDGGAGALWAVWDGGIRQWVVIQVVVVRAVGGSYDERDSGVIFLCHRSPKCIVRGQGMAQLGWSGKVRAGTGGLTVGQGAILRKLCNRPRADI